MRSIAEYRFRLRQELVNLRFALFPPNSDGKTGGILPVLPDAGRVFGALSGSKFALETERIAEDVLAGRIPLLGTGIEIDPGSDIRWRKDYRSGVETPARYFRRIPYLDFSEAGDHKLIWELNRHQHWVLLAQAWRFTGRAQFRDRIEQEFRSWRAQNPFQCGINWASALEVAFRALSWMWVLHFLEPEPDSALPAEMVSQLYLHGLHLEYNLSIYFSPNTHLLGEAVALHAMGVLFPALPRAARWREIGGRIVERELDRQVHPDGSHFEHSTWYSVYALDFFLLYTILAGRAEALRPRLQAMAHFLDAMLGPQGELPYFGDDDGGRLFHPYGQRNRFGRASLGTCGVLFHRPEWIRDPEALDEQAVWWLGEGALETEAAARPRGRCELFPDIGLAVMECGSLSVVADGGPFGVGSGGHSHSDTLSFTVCSAGEWILIDPGTFTYISDPEARDAFRGSAYHNTLRIDGFNQAEPVSAFRWIDPPKTRVEQWRSNESESFFQASCGYRGFEHRRRFWFRKPDLLVILDEISGPEGEHEIERFWHTGFATRLGDGFFQIGPQILLNTGSPASEITAGWRSAALLSKEPAPVIRSLLRTAVPLRKTARKTAALWPAAISFRGLRVSVSAEYRGKDVICRVSDGSEEMTLSSAV